MAVVRPFQAIRPQADMADQVAALPYDVMSSEEAREMVKDNPYSFLHVDKAEIDLDPAVNLYDSQVYAQARSNLEKLQADGVLIKDAEPRLYIYRLIMQGRSQTGVVGCTSIDDYLQNAIKKHEHTRADKEQDRIRHVNICNANTGPIFLTYRAQKEINLLVDKWTRTDPLYNFTAEDGVTHMVWAINNEQDINQLRQLFAGVECLYIADGHHRCASAVKVGQMRREQKTVFTGNEEFNYFLSVIFPDQDLYIMDYNRVVQDLNGYDREEFIRQVSDKFIIKPAAGTESFRPQRKHTFGMYLDGEWYELTAKDGSFAADDPVERLDVSILQNNLLQPILGISDPRTDKRIDFIGGIRGLGELEKRVKSGMRVAFSMYPTTIEDLMNIADAGEVMPPKSTWFEPKLRSGLFIHELS
ncbi:MAG: DUF1015 domain-containing protein [Methylocystaceae bacterium]